VRKIRIGISIASIAFLTLLLCGYLWQENRITAKAEEVILLTQEKDSYNVPLTQDLIMALYAKVNQKRHLISLLSQRYYCSAIMAEISRLTPDNIQLIALRAAMNDPLGDSRKNSPSKLEIEGVISGDQIRFETDLASYMLTMEASPVFRRPTVKNKRLQFLNDRQVLRFSIRFELT
jgi:Tfp pilus assembly protein PilN